MLVTDIKKIDDKRSCIWIMRRLVRYMHLIYED